MYDMYDMQNYWNGYISAKHVFTGLGDFNEQSMERHEKLGEPGECRMVAASCSEEAVKPDPESTPQGSPTDDDFQPAKKRFRAPGNPQVVYLKL